MVIYLYIGKYLKKNDKFISAHSSSIFIISLLIYILYVWVLIHHNLHLPRLTLTLSIYPLEILPFVVGALTGTNVVLHISRKIVHNTLLEFFGRNSLLIYLTHWIIIKLLILMWNHFCPLCHISPLVMSIVLFFTTLSICTLLIQLFKNKYLSWMLGKW